MARPAQLIGLALCSALLVPAMPVAGEAAQNAGRLRGIGDRFLALDRITRPTTVEEPVTLAVTQIPGFLGTGDPLQLGTTQEPWDLDPLNEAGPQVKPLPLQAELPLILAQANDRQSEADRLYNQGLQQFNTSQYQAALESWQAALAIYREIGNRRGEGDTLNVLGLLFRIAGQPQTAIDLHQQALEIAREIGNRAGEGRALGNLGIAYNGLGQYERAADFHEQRLVIARELGDRAGEGCALGNLGIAYNSLGQYERAIDFYEQRLTIAREIGDRAGESRALGGLGLAYNNLYKYEHAIDFYEQYLAISREIGDRPGEAYALNNLGNAYNSLGQYERAIDFHEQALAITREISDRAGEGNALNNLGIAYRNLGQYERAIDLHEQELEIAREIGDRTGEGAALNNLGNTYDSLGQYDRAINFFEQALEIVREIGNRAGEGAVLGNLGNAYFNLGQYQRTIDLYEQALEIAREIGNRTGEGAALNNLGLAYNKLGQYDRAIDFYEQALAFFREIGDRAGESFALSNLGLAHNNLGQYERAIDFYEQALEIVREIGDRAGENLSLVNLGLAYNNLGQYERAIDLQQQALDIARGIGNRAGEAYALGNLGVAYDNLGQTDRALEQYGQAVALFNGLGVRTEEALLLSNIGKLLNRRSQPELAIIFLKASVDIHEEIRGDIRGLDTNLQQSFTDTVASDYRLLADLLLQQNRIIEAQRVLDLLKVQELDEYLEDVQRSAGTETRVDYWQPEEDVLALYDEVLLAGTELARLQARDPNTLTPAEDARLRELEAQQNRLYTSFINWLDHPQIFAALDQLRVDTRSRTVDIDNFTDLQDNLRQLPQTSVILYPLVLENRLELVLVSADAPPVRYPIDVDALTLNRTVVAFGQALKDPGSDPRATAQQLYNWVIAPLEADLATLGVANIIFAPDGVLRYVPLAALHDGEQWLVERFSFNQITAASETDFAAAPRDDRSLLAAACSACTFSVNVGDDTFNFGDLPATRQEVELLAEQIPGTEVLIDGDFTPDQFQGLLSRYSLIHLATHGLFVSGSPDESFLLFGDGQSVNLRQINRQWRQLDADLVVLSACETALGSAELGNGVEVLGLGFQLQRVGAKAVVASLWRVSDQGTQALMAEFYAALMNGDTPMTKAQALQAAQVALIQNQSFTTGGPLRAGARPVAEDGRALGTPALPGYSHPYYWAAFILIGNGL